MDTISGSTIVTTMLDAKFLMKCRATSLLVKKHSSMVSILFDVFCKVKVFLCIGLFDMP